MASSMEKKNDKEIALTFFKITKVRPFSKAFNLKLKEGDILLRLNGEQIQSSYEEFRKQLDENSDNKIISILRGNVTFNIITQGSLGVICETVEEKEVENLNEIKLEELYNKNLNYKNFEVFKNINRQGLVIPLDTSILPSIAPPLWMTYHKMWVLLSFTLVFYFIMFYVSPWLFFLAWILKSWYYGNNQIDVLRFYYKLKEYRFWLSLASENEEDVQKKSRELDPKIDFEYSYLDPPIIEEETLPGN